MIKAFLGFLFLTSFAHATLIKEGHFNPVTQNLDMILVYSGGHKVHQFSLEWDACQVASGSNEIAARLIDSGWDDTGTEELSRAVSFNLANLQCKPAQLTIFSDQHSRLTLWIE